MKKRSLYGYDCHIHGGDSHKFRVNQTEAKEVSRIFELYLSGKSINDIVRTLNSSDKKGSRN